MIGYRRIIISFSVVLFFAYFFQLKAENSSFRISKNLSIFNSVIKELDVTYVDTLDYDKLVQVAIQKMLDELDPYTEYIPMENISDLTYVTTGEYAGVGAIIAKQGEDIVVVEPYEGFPACRAGVRAGDVVLEINGKKVSALTVGEVSSLLKGLPNSTVVLKIKRFGEREIIEKRITREKIQISPIAHFQVIAPNVGYVLLRDFTDKSAWEFRAVVQEMIKASNVKSLVIDLRNNGGGLIEEAVKILGYFLPKGTEVVKLKGRVALLDKVYKTPLEPVFSDLELVVITNQGTASASEILAGAIQDLDRGVVVGERTFGKGLVQNVKPLDYGGNLKVTSAKYYTPSGRCIQAVDYSRRSENGIGVSISDSLKRKFRTTHGREVRDGGGILPDLIVSNESKVDVAYQLYSQNIFFNYATKYFYTHQQVETPDKFTLSEEEFDDFVRYLIDSKFTYSYQSTQSFNQFLEDAQFEGIDSVFQSEILLLKKKMVPDIKVEIASHKAEIIQLLSMEILKRYYYQKGEIMYSLREDECLNKALMVLSDKEAYYKILLQNLNY